LSVLLTLSLAGDSRGRGTLLNLREVSPPRDDARSVVVLMEEFPDERSFSIESAP
jgi:hypothetical protein